MEGGGWVGKVMRWGDGAPGVLIMRTGGAAAAATLEADGEFGVAGEREMMVPPGRVTAGEPWRIVMGGPLEGVKTRDEAEGSRVIGELPTVAMTGVGIGGESGFGAEAEPGIGVGLEESRMVVAGLAGCPLLTGPVGATTS